LPDCLPWSFLKMSIRLYIGNLPEEVDQQALEALFTAAGDIISTKVIRDRKTRKCRGFGFLTVATEELAQQYIEKFNGYAFGDVSLKIEVAQPRQKGEEGSPEGGETSEDTPPAKPILASARAQNSGDNTSNSSSGSSSGGGGKKRNRHKSRSQNTSTTSTSTTPSTPVQPDPRWASQLQRIKEQLQAANQP
jgi:RNA recognition motif-containing protein